jgi:hypothetical protein
MIFFVSISCFQEISPVQNSVRTFKFQHLQVFAHPPVSFLSTYLPTCVSVCLSVRLIYSNLSIVFLYLLMCICICVSTDLSVYLSICISVPTDLSMYLSIYRSIMYLSMYMCICVFIYRSILPLIHVSIHLVVCLAVGPVSRTPLP